jgi:hypothetical protein
MIHTIASQINQSSTWNSRMPTADIRAYVLRNVMDTAMAYSVHSSVEPPAIVSDRQKEGRVTVDHRVIRKGRRTAGGGKEKDICVNTSTSMQVQELLTLPSIHPCDTPYQVLDRT